MNPIAPFLILHLVDDASTDFLFSEVAGASASGDTPATIPFYPLMRSPGTPVSWSVIDTKAGWADMGGAVHHPVYTFTMENPENTDTHTRPLDNLLGLVFKGQTAIWYGAEFVATGTDWTIPTLASSEKIGQGTVLSADFTGDTFTVRVREITKETLSVMSAPLTLFGRGGGVRVEDGGTPTTGARITRPDESGLRGTSDQWFSACFALQSTGSSGASSHLIIDTPIFRLQSVPATDTVDAQLKNAAGTWVTVGTSLTYTSDVAIDTYSILLNYDSGATSAELFLDAVSAGSTTITGGIFVSSAANSTWYNAADAGLVRVTHWFFRAGTRKLDATEIEDRALYTFDFFNETGLTCALEMNERIDPTIQDSAGNEAASLDGFSNTDGAWWPSSTGEAGRARSRPIVRVGRPFNARVEFLDVAFGIISGGFEGNEMDRGARAVLGDGARLRADVQQGSAASCTFTSATNQASAVFAQNEAAAGQKLSFDSGANAGIEYSVDSLVLDPITGVDSSLLAAVIFSDTVTVIDETVSGKWSGTLAESVWTQDSFDAVNGEVRDAFQHTLFIEQDFRQMALGIQYGVLRISPPVLDSAGFLATNYLRFLGPQITPTATGLESIDLGLFGWQGEGSADALKEVHELAKVTPSATDYGPSSVYTRFSDSSLRVTGGDLDASGSADFTFGEERIESADPDRLDSRYESVRVRYAKNWGFKGGGEALPVLLSSRDSLAQAIASEWREVTAGTAGTELVLDTYFLRRSDAQSFADAVQTILDDGIPYDVSLYGPLNRSELIMEPFDVVDITWSPDSLLSGGKKGLAVAFKVRSDWSATIKVYFEK